MFGTIKEGNYSGWKLHYHMNMLLLPMALMHQGPFGGGLAKMRPWAIAYVHRAVANFFCVIVLKLFNLPGAHIIQK